MDQPEAARCEMGRTPDHACLRPDQLTGPGDLQVTTDYRDVLAELLVKRLGNRNIDEVFPGHQMRPVGVFA